MSAAHKVARRAKRIVVKVGSSVLTRDGAVHDRAFRDIVGQVSELVGSGRQVTLVSSGAIAIGARRLGWKHPGRSIPEKQAAAAVGQIGLVERYRRGFAQHDLQVGQVLLTRTGLQERERFHNARRTLLELLKRKVVPIVNENDTVSTEEIRFGDNDNLSATVVNAIGADLLILLTDVDGLYREAPEAGRDVERFSVVERIDASVLRAAQGSNSAFGRGGMVTKLEAAKTAARSGAACVVANGGRKDVLLQVARGEDCGTLFLPGPRLSSRKHWLAFTAKARGGVVLDAGASRALRERGRSLLPAGITAVRGEFGIGDPVSCFDAEGLEFARGLSSYPSSDIVRICGLPTPQIERVLGYSNGSEVIHRDDLVLLDP